MTILSSCGNFRYKFMVAGLDCCSQLNTFFVFGKNVQVSGVIFLHGSNEMGGFDEASEVHICNSQRVYPKPPNNLHLISIWVKYAGVWGKITPMKRGVLMKHQKSLPKTSKYFTPALVFGLNV